jgi:AcrR family transcriptional regulator
VTRDDILQAALTLVRQSGAESLNARNLAFALGCSTQPVFTHFATMEDLRAAVWAEADKYQSHYLTERVVLDQDVMGSFGLAFVDFALAEPNLFHFLAYDRNAEDATEVVTNEDCHGADVNAIRRLVSSDDEAANLVFIDMWLYANGLATALVANQLDLDRDQITAMVTRMGRLLAADPPIT